MSKRARRRLDAAPSENGGMLTALLAMLYLMIVYVLRHPATLDEWEGWDEWGTTTAEAGVRGWTTSGNFPSMPTGRFSGQAVRWPNNSISTHAFPVSNARMTVGFAWRTTNASQSQTIMEFREGSTTHGRLAYNGNGTFTVSRSGTTLSGSPTANLGIAANTWYYLELDYTVHDSTGAYEFRVNGTNVASGSGLDTRNGGTGIIDTLAIQQPNATANDWDDYYAASGSTSFQGDSRVITDMPNADGASSAWTASSGSDYQCVDEIPYNSDTDYISTSTATADDTFAFPSTGVTGTVLGVQTQAIARKDDAAARNLALLVDSGGTLDVGSSQALGGSYAKYNRTDLVDPDTGSAWAMTAVNAAEYGVRNV